MADATMSSLKDTLRSTMDKLSMDEFKRFKHHLKDMGQVPWSQLQTADQLDTVELMVQTYTKESSGLIVYKILKKMNLNQMASDLDKELTGENSACTSISTGWESVIHGQYGHDASDVAGRRKQSLQRKWTEKEEEVKDGEQKRNRTDVSGSLCSLHRQELKLFCQDDRELVCYECRNSNNHKNHNFRPMSTTLPALREELRIQMESLKKQMKLREEVKVTCEQTSKHIESQIQETEAKIKVEFEKLHQFLRDEEAARIAAVKDEWAWKSVMMKEKIEEMSREISSLSDTIRDIEGSAGADDVTFMQNYKSTVVRAQCTLQDPERVSGALINVAKHLGNLKYRVWEKMQEVVQYTPVILDPNTAHKQLTLSEDLTSVRISVDCQQLPDNPERFDEYIGVMGSEGFDSGKQTWDVEVGGNPWWAVGVMTESLQRKGNDLGVGRLYVWYKGIDDGSDSPSQVEPLNRVKQKLQRIRVQMAWDRRKLSFSDPDNNKYQFTIPLIFTERMFPFLSNGWPLSPLRIVQMKPSVRLAQHSSMDLN